MATNKKSRQVSAAPTLKGLSGDLRKNIASFLRVGNDFGRGDGDGDLILRNVHPTFQTNRDGEIEAARPYILHGQPAYNKHTVLKGLPYENLYLYANIRHNKEPERRYIPPYDYRNPRPPAPPKKAYAKAGMAKQVQDTNVEMVRDLKLHTWLFDDEGRNLEDIPNVSANPDLHHGMVTLRQQRNLPKGVRDNIASYFPAPHRFDYHWDANELHGHYMYNDRPRP